LPWSPTPAVDVQPAGAPLPVAPETIRLQDGLWARTPMPRLTVESKLPEMLSVSNVKAEALPI